MLVDIVPEEPCIDAATLSKGISPRGKRGPACANGMRQGLNDYTEAFKDDPNNEGHYYGYDGPCPPWNDERVHRYVFTVYAVDFPLLPLKGNFNGRDVKEAMKGHILASASTVGTYTPESEADQKFLIGTNSRAAFRGPFRFLWDGFLTEPKRFAPDLLFPGVP